MKVFTNILKLLTALAAVAGAVYVIATYGEQIVAWAKKVLASLPCPNCEEAEPVSEEATAEDAPTEATPVEEAAAEEVPAEEIPAEEVAEVVAEENEPVAEEADFAE